MQSIVEVVYGSNKTYNSVYTDPSFCKMVIVQDDDKFPPPRLCLLRRWPNFEGGFGFNLYEGELNSSGALKVEEVVRHSPAEAGGLRKNDVIIEINGENIELKSFFPLVEILKEACSQAEMELLVLAEQDAQWYRVRNITVNSNFPNIEYCETPYYGHILKPIESAQHKSGNPQFEIHSGTGKVYRTTLLIDKEGDSVYKKIEELDPATNAGEQTIPPLRPDGTFRHPGSDNGTVRVYYRRDRNFNSTIKSNEFDSGHGTLSNRRSTPLSTNQAQNHYNTMSPYSTLGKSYGDSLAVDLLHDKWADLMDKYLDNKFRSSSKDGARVDVEPTAQQQQQQQQQQPDRDTSATRRTHVIRLNDPNATVSSKRSRSRCQSPNDASFSYLYSGRDDYQTASATSFRDLNSLHRGSPQTQSYNRYNVQSPNRVANRNTSSSQSRPHSQQPPQDHTKNQASSLNKTPASVKPATITEIPPYVAYESSSYSKINSNVIYDSQEAELLENSSLINKPQHSNTSPIISSVLAQKQERELREKLEREKIEREQQEKLEKERLELRLKQEREERERLERLERERLELRLKQEREERDRFEREKQERFERELKLQQEREEREREERERERIERERRELERIRREKLERERLELEKLEQERVEREKELERKRQEQEERDRIEREEFLKQLKEREERERNERELERERLRAESEKRLREIMERDERERKEREQLFFASQQQPQQQAVQSDVKTALAALTTIVVTGSEPEIKRPIATTDEIITTTTINEIHEIKHEVVEEELIQKPVIYEQNKDVIETYNTQTYDDASDTESQSSSEEEKARRQFAEQEFARQQEVMKHLVLAMEKPKMKDKLKTYNVYNSQHFFGYGIAFHTEHIPATLPEHKLVYPLVEIEQGSPSDEAGMRNGQRVVAVNGKFVNNEISTLEDVVQEIEDSYYARSYTEITVVEPELWSQCMENPEYAAELANWREVKIQEPLHQQPEQPVSAVHQLVEAVLNKKTPEIDDAKFRTKPRLVQMSRNLREDQYGFDFKTIRHEGRHVANNVKPESIADRAGLRNDDIILEVNGELVHGMEHDAVVKRISSNPFRVDLLVIADPNSYFLMVGKTEEVAKAEQPQHDEVNIDLRVPSSKVTYHRVNLDPNFKGLGISLTPNGIISNIEPGSPSDKAGLKKDHKIVEVNGIDVRDKSNKDIASLIKQNEGNLVIGVIDTALGQNINADVSQTLINAVNQQAQIAEAQVVKEYDENIILTNKQALTVGSQSVSSATGKKLAEVAGTRVCNMVTRPDYNGFGFSIRGNDRGPHQVSAVEPKSPAEQSGLKVEDLILKVNDLNVVGERYSKTVTLIKNESDKGRLKLEVIDQKSCPKEIREVTLVAPSGYSTVSASYTKNQKNKKFESTQNLRDIAAEIVNSERSRSVDTASDRNRARPYSMTDIDRVPVNNSTIRSIQSVGSTATGYSQSNLANVSSKSAGNLTQIDLQAPKFKRCVVQLIEGFTGYGFTLNSKVKPKYMIFTVDPKSPAYAANLRSTDVIVEIDRKNIRRLKFDKVRQMLSDSVKKGQVEILAISKEGYMYYKNKKKNFSSKKLVSLDNTEPYSTLQGIQTRDSSVNLNTRNISSDNEGDRDRSVGVSLQRTSTSPTTNRKEASQSPSRVTGTDLDLYDIIQCTVTRRPDGTLGLSLSPQKEPRSLSRSSGIEDLKSAQTLPVISNIEPNSPAEESGLRVGDTVLEINGKSTSAQPNSTIVSWIKTAGKQIDFTVSREKKLTEDDLLKQNAKHITDVVIENALSKLPEQKQTTPVIPARRLSRKDSASLSSSKVQSQQNSPLLVNSEIRMSSSKLYQADLAQSPASSAPQSPRVSPRNQSEPAPIINELNKSLNQNQTQSSPISRRSSSSYTLPRDAPIPRLCRVRVYEDQLGFTIAGSKSSRGIFKISEVTPNSSAAHSGLLNDDYIIEISGVNVESMSYSDVVDLLRQKKLQDDLQLLVVDRQTLEWYKSKKIPISSQIVPKMQYIETLLKEELEKELEQSNGLNNNDQLRSSQKGFKIPYQSGRSVWIKRRIYLCGPPVNTRSYSSIDLSDRNN